MILQNSASWHARLPGLSILSVSGADTQDFLQGQLSNDIDALGDDRCQWTGYHQPDGRVLATALVIPHEQVINLILSTDIADEIRERLSRYILRAKVELHASESIVTGLYGTDLAARLPAFSLPQAGAVSTTSGGLVLAGYSGHRVLAWGPPESADWQAIAGSLDEAPQSKWQLEDIRDGIPHLSKDSQALYTAQMLNLDLLGAISFSKGCYTGQEIVSRTQNLGKIKRRLFRFGCTSKTISTEVCLASGDKVGQILTSVRSADDGSYPCECLAVVRLDRHGADLFSGDTPLVLLDLPYQ